MIAKKESFTEKGGLRKEASPFFVCHIPSVVLLNKTERLQTEVCSRSQRVEKFFRPADPIFRTL